MPSTIGYAPGLDAELLIAVAAGVTVGSEVWLSSSDRVRAAYAALDAFDEALRSDDTFSARDAIESLLPEDILAMMIRRVDRCWDRYRRVLTDDQRFIPEELDEATAAVQSCLCRELYRILRLNRSLPSVTLQKYWNAYCGKTGTLKDYIDPH